MISCFFQLLWSPCWIAAVNLPDLVLDYRAYSFSLLLPFSQSLPSRSCDNLFCDLLLFLTASKEPDATSFANVIVLRRGNGIDLQFIVWPLEGYGLSCGNGVMSCCFEKKNYVEARVTMYVVHWMGGSYERSRLQHVRCKFTTIAAPPSSLEQ